ncbi:NAD(P)-dependent oxidoreductase, partial [Alphaproteobacteria bacterium]|nr:NAD(P)-dependent oxidoreductase [Alphaproteobacteria bacterium]
MAKAAFLGLGVMGYPMAGHLAAAGHEVTVYNRTSEKVEAWAQEHKGKSARTPADAARGADFVFACVGDDPDVRAVATGDHGAFGAMKVGAIYVDHTTASAELARELYETAEKAGIAFIDGPVSGGQAGAENGALTVMCGGDAEPFGKAK